MLVTDQLKTNMHCVKSVHIWNFFGTYIPAFIFPHTL